MNDRNSKLLTWIKRIGIGLLAILLIVVLLVAGTIIFDSLFGIDTADFTNVEYKDASGQELLGYLAEPDEPGPHPAILLIHEWWGLNEGMTVLADALAEARLCRIRS